MLLVGRYSKETTVKSTNIGYENNSSFTTFLKTPLRDTSLVAAEREKSASLNKLRTRINKKKQKLESFKQRLSFEKHKFAEFEKYQKFNNRINQIIEDR